MTHTALLIAALVLDALFGEPDWAWKRAPHPAVLMGRLVGWLDSRWNSGSNRRAKGVAVMVGLVAAFWALGLAIATLPGGWLWQVLLAAILLAQRSLADHVSQVAQALRSSLADGRVSVARIVGRDTADMNASAVARGAIESAAENLSDGVVAPAFWYLLFGLPGLLVYKITNTADSMVGYRTERHAEFGWAAARFDDLLNLIPARLTAGLVLLVHWRPDLWPILRRDARLHRSPNAGWPEAAFAGVLDVSLAGPRAYGGESQEFPFVHPDGRRTLLPQDIEAAVRLLWRTWALGLLPLVVLAGLFSGL